MYVSIYIYTFWYNYIRTHIYIYICIYIYTYTHAHTHIVYIYIYIYTSSTAQGGGGSFKNRKPIGEVGCCESRMAERIHWWTERWLELCFLEWLQWLQWSPGRSPHPQLLDVQRRPAHAKPDFNWLSGPRNGTWKRTRGISCLRSLAPMWRFAMQQTPKEHSPILRYSALLRAMF